MPVPRTGKENGYSRLSFLASLSAALELRLALLVERSQTFLAVIGPHQAVVGFDLEPHRRGQIHMQAVADRVLRLPYGKRCLRGDAPRRFESFLDQFFRLAHFVD